jgi:hypothetical protein
METKIPDYNLNEGVCDLYLLCTKEQNWRVVILSNVALVYLNLKYIYNFKGLKKNFQGVTVHVKSCWTQ